MLAVRSRLRECTLAEPAQSHVRGLFRRALSNKGLDHPVQDPEAWVAGLDYLANRVVDPEYDLLPVVERHSVEPWRILGVLQDLRDLSEFRAYVGEWIRSGEALSTAGPPETPAAGLVVEGDDLTGLPLDDPFAIADLDPEPLAPLPVSVRHAVEAIALPSRWGAPFAPYAWQLEAAFAWNAAGNRGIFEVVTGAGKTAVALLALAKLLDEADRTDAELQAIIVVPRVALVEQWRKALSATLSTEGLRIGEIHGLSKCLPEAQDILIITQDSARIVLMAMPLTRPTFLIADECHRLGAPASSQILDREWDYTLGLSATPERSGDLAFEEVLVPRIGPVVYRYGYEEAVRDGILAPFDLLRVQVEFTADEQYAYDRQTEQVKSLLSALKATYPALRRAQGPRFFQVLGDLKRRLRDERFEMFTALANQRRMTAHMAAEKLSVARLLAGVLPSGRRVLCFHERIEAADAIEGILRSTACPVATYHTGLDSGLREANLEGFRSGRYQWLVACRALDEGLDIPAVDTVAIFAGSKSARQLIQRLGRALRRKPDGRSATVLLIEVAGVDNDLLEQSGLAALRAAASSESVVPLAGLAEVLRTGPRIAGGTLNRTEQAPSSRGAYSPSSRSSGHAARLISSASRWVRDKFGLRRSPVDDSPMISSPRRGDVRPGSSWTGTPGNISYYDKDSSPD